ncbi:hypothetical protein NQ317_019000 [Molorchus minor]|uniref:Uncharacterized protein n=1 Tax=Molorchus minor TaxID=1323400 RepID=A0ABQ9IRT7_9CUCU|nr:hypothetical protein NQ317_019000 [Molorchus minor]
MTAKHRLFASELLLPNGHTSTNMTDFNKRKMIEEQTFKGKFDRVSWKKAIVFDWTRTSDPMVHRQLRMLTTNTRAKARQKINITRSSIRWFLSRVRFVWYQEAPLTPPVAVVAIAKLGARSERSAAVDEAPQKCSRALFRHHYNSSRLFHC